MELRNFNKKTLKAFRAGRRKISQNVDNKIKRKVSKIDMASLRKQKGTKSKLAPSP